MSLKLEKEVLTEIMANLELQLLHLKEKGHTFRVQKLEKLIKKIWDQYYEQEKE